MPDQPEVTPIATAAEPLSKYDLRLRSIDREQGEPINVCSCGAIAKWSVWLHTPGWGEQGGDTRVVCLKDALLLIVTEANRA